ncbi:MAG: hypothetical protein J6W08_02045 [Alphaproteobacteria bacterium]|nr:hypothetical protein [Alphaproteobacteria bacterium]
MKITKILFALICGAFIGGANAANISIYYSPTCPHCHHARDFISSALIYEYNDLQVTEVNVTNIDNRQAFVDALFKCGYQKGGVPVIVIGDMNVKDGFKCFQGYADSMQNDLRSAVEMDLTDEQKSAAAANKAEMTKNKDAFVTAHADRKGAIKEIEPQKKNN